MKYIIALTGGIGSGKNTVANAFSQYGIDIIDTDTIARKIVEPGTFALKAITKYFTKLVINQNGTLNRRALRERIFSTPTDKIWLNKLLFPLIYKETQRQLATTISPYVVWVVPLLIENNLYKQADRILVVDVAIETQIKRTMQRDGVSRLHVEQIISVQATREARLSIADDIIDNNGKKSSIVAYVADLHSQYLYYSLIKKKLHL